MNRCSDRSGARLVCAVLLASAMVTATAAPGRAESPEDAGAADATAVTEGSANATGGGSAGEEKPGDLRPPAEVRGAPRSFEGDLEPLGAKMQRRLLKRLCTDSPEKLDEDSSAEAPEHAAWACRTCPAFTSRGGESETLTLDRAVRGDFMRRKKKEIFVTYRGCEPVSAVHGGAVIFRKRKGRWHAFYRHPGLNPQQCLKFHSEKREDRLICRLRHESNGKVVQKIADAATGRGMRVLVRSTDNTGMCPRKKFVSSYLRNWKRQDLNGDGRPDLYVEKIQRWRSMGKKHKKRVCRLEQVKGGWSRVRRYEMEFHFIGNQFRQKSKRTTSLLAGASRAEASN